MVLKFPTRHCIASSQQSTHNHSVQVQQQIYVSRHRKLGERLPTNAPGLIQPLRFAGAGLIKHREDALRNIWHRCYFGKDFEGAAMVWSYSCVDWRLFLTIFSVALQTLGVMAEVEPLAPADVSAAARLLWYTDNPTTAVKRLVQGVLKSTTRSGERKTDAIQVSVELLLSVGEVAAARKLLQDSIVDLTHQERTELLCYDTLVLVASCIMLVNDINSLVGGTLHLPSVEDVLADPFEFSKCIKVMNTIRTTQAISNHRVKSRKQECKLLLQDLKASFNVSVASATVGHERMTMEAMYVAYLVGLEHTSKASRYIANLRRHLPVGSHRQGDVALEQAYYSLLSAYLVRHRYELPSPPVEFSVREASFTATAATADNSGTASARAVSTASVDYSAGAVDAGYLRIVNALLKAGGCPSSGEAPSLLFVHKLRCLYQTRLLRKEDYVDRLCDAIERSGNPFCSPSCAQVDQSAAVVRYLLWRYLCAALGPLPHRMDENAAMTEGCEVWNYLSGRSALVTGGSAAEGSIDDLSTVLAKRSWWRTSILSAQQLNGFSDAERILSGNKGAVEALLQAIRDGDGGFATDADSDEEDDEAGGYRGVHLQAADSYASWLRRDREFADAVTGVFAASQRKMSVDNDNESDDGGGGRAMVTVDALEEEAGDEVEDGAGGNIEASQMSNVSNDEAEYMSQESEAELAPGVAAGMPAGDSTGTGNDAEGDSATGSASGSSQGDQRGALATAQGGRFVKDVLSLAVQNASGRDVVTVQPPLAASHFAVHKVIQQVSAGKNKKPIVLYALGDALLEVLSCQALLRARMHDQDNLFTVRAVQALFAQAIHHEAEGSDKAVKCLRRLAAGGVCIERALKLANHVAERQLQPCSADGDGWLG